MSTNRLRAFAATWILIFFTVSLPSLYPVYASAAHATLTEWTLPIPNSGPRGLVLDPSGNCCWFVEYFGNKVGHLDPSNNTFQEWAIPTQLANPNSLAITVVSGSLVVWGTESGADKIFSFSPRSDLYYEYNLTQSNSGVLGVGSISAEPPAPQVRLWFTEAFNNTNGEFVYDPRNGNVTLYEDSFPTAVGGGAYGVYAGSNSVWYAGFSSLVRWDRASSQYTMWPLPTHGSAIARSITLDQYGEPWYVQGVVDGGSSNNFVGVLRGNSTFQEWRIPSVGADPRMISLNPITQEPWIAEQSSQAGNGTIATLGTLTGGTLVPSLPTVAPSGGNATTLSPIVNSVPLSTYDVVPTTSSISGSQNGQFSGYGF